MARTLAIVAAIVVVATSGNALASLTPGASITPFGGAEPIQIAHIGRIEVDLQPPGSNRLRHVPRIDLPTLSGVLLDANAPPNDERRRHA
jgi:hypothetical protein